MSESGASARPGKKILDAVAHCGAMASACDAAAPAEQNFFSVDMLCELGTLSFHQCYLPAPSAIHAGPGSGGLRIENRSRLGRLAVAEHYAVPPGRTGWGGKDAAGLVSELALA